MQGFGAGGWGFGVGLHKLAHVEGAGLRRDAEAAQGLGVRVREAAQGLGVRVKVRVYLAHIEGAGLRRDAEAVGTIDSPALHASYHERAKAVGVTNRDEAVVGHDDARKGALEQNNLLQQISMWLQSIHRPPVVMLIVLISIYLRLRHSVENLIDL